MSKVAIIGFGNVGYHLAVNISKKHDVTVYGRTPDDDLILDLSTLDPSAYDFVIIAVPDSAIKSVAENIGRSDAIVLHTSGSRPVSDVAMHDRHGVIYPLQTFSKEKKVDFKSFPIFIEGNDDTDKSIFSFVRTFSNDVRFLGSRNRKRLHLAAVFACNFTNHMYYISEQILSEMDLSFPEIAHLAQETISKAAAISPSQAQTGPAVRGDQKTIETHLEMINNEEWKKIYQLLSEDIRKSQE